MINSQAGIKSLWIKNWNSEGKPGISTQNFEKCRFSFQNSDVLTTPYRQKCMEIVSFTFNGKYSPDYGKTDESQQTPSAFKPSKEELLRQISEVYPGNPV